MSCARWVLILYQSRADRSELPFAHINPRISENHQHKIETDQTALTPIRDHTTHFLDTGTSVLDTQQQLADERVAELQESKKQRFAILTNDEYATLSTLLQERESINTRRAICMAVRTYRSYINVKAIILNLCFKFYSRAIFVIVI